MAPEELLGDPHIQRILHHTSAQEAGRLFAKTRPKMAAFTHLVMLGSDTVPPPTIDALLAATRQAYTGPSTVGEDLISFEIGETVVVRNPASIGQKVR